MGEPIGCLALRERGGAVAALQSGFHLFDFDTAEKTPVVDSEVDRPQSRFNDGALDRQGRFWAGTMPEPLSGESFVYGSLPLDEPVTINQPGQFSVEAGAAIAVSPNPIRHLFAGEDGCARRDLAAPATIAHDRRRVGAAHEGSALRAPGLKSKKEASSSSR